MTLFIVAIVLFLVAVYLVAAYIMAGSIIHLNRQPVPKNPKDYGMDFEDIKFKASDGVKIKGWLDSGY